MIAPGSEAELADAIRAARAPLAVEGLGSKRGWLRPVQAAETISTRALAGITLYAPKELVISARAGTPLSVIEAALAAEGQYLIAEPPHLHPEQTIGGLVAANLSGPRRVAWGAMRDHLLGIRAVDGAGETFHSGGRVLKNVTGLDLCKLLAGSFGTLAVMTEITLKVLPRPEAAGTVAVRVADAARGVAALSAALGSPFSVSGAAYLPGEGLAFARIEDFAASVAYRTERLRDVLKEYGPAEIVPAGTGEALWARIRDTAPLPAEAEAVWRVSVAPSAGPAMLEAGRQAGLDGFLDWGGGLVWLAGPGNEAAHGAVCAAARAAGGVWWLVRAPDGLRAAADVVPPEPPALAAIRAKVAAVFDPAGLLNPGRLRAN